MGEEVKPRYYVTFVALVSNGLRFGSAQVRREMETWDDIAAVRAQLANAEQLASDEDLQIINWKRIQ